MKLGRLRCGCTCRNHMDWEPEGDGYIQGASIACCDVTPCEFIGVFERCSLEACEDLCIESYTSSGSATGLAVLSLSKDRCITEESCRYTNRRLLDGCTNPYSFRTTACGLLSLGPSLDGVCNGTFTQFFGSIKDGAYVTPILGCGDTGNTDNPGAPGRCGWYDLYRMIACSAGLEGLSDSDRILAGDYVTYVEWLETCTEVAWEYSFDSGSGEATLVGHAPGGDVITYATSDFVCGEQVTLTLAGDSTLSCPHWPRQVCVGPASTFWQTECEDGQAAVDCCDPGMRELNFEMASDCASVNGLEICTSRYNNDGNWYNDDDEVGGTIPSEFTSYIPVGACGFFYGTVSYTVNSTGRSLVLFAWCESGDWKYTLLCAATGSPFTDISVLCEAEALTMTECCPYPQFAAIECSGLDLDSPCCDQPEPCCADTDLPASITASITGVFSKTVNMPEDISADQLYRGTFTEGACTLALFLSCDPDTGTWTAGIRFAGGGGLGCLNCETTDSSADLISCDPFLATASMTLGGGCTLGAGVINITFTE